MVLTDSIDNINGEIIFHWDLFEYYILVSIPSVLLGSILDADDEDDLVPSINIYNTQDVTMYQQLQYLLIIPKHTSDGEIIITTVDYNGSAIGNYHHLRDSTHNSNGDSHTIGNVINISDILSNSDCTRISDFIKFTGSFDCDSDDGSSNSQPSYCQTCHQ